MSTGKNCFEHDDTQKDGSVVTQRSGASNLLNISVVQLSQSYEDMLILVLGQYAALQTENFRRTLCFDSMVQGEVFRFELFDRDALAAAGDAIIARGAGTINCQTAQKEINGRLR